MYSEIEIFESLVRDKLSNLDNISVEILSETISAINILDKQIRKVLIKSVFELKKDRLIEFYIQDFQKRLINLSNNIYSFTSSKKINNAQMNPGALINIKSSILITIDSLLLFLDINFSKYVNRRISIPDKLKDEFVLMFSERLAKIEDLFKKPPDELILIVLKPITEFVENKNALSYHQLSYISLLTDKLIQFLEKDEKLKYSFQEELISLNFNSIAFLHFLTVQIEHDLDELDYSKDKIEKLFWYLKWIKQIQISEFAFYTSRKSIKELLIEWINEEISFLDKTMLLNNLPKSGIKIPEEKEFKLVTDLSVSQLAFLVRVFVDSGLFKNENDRAIAKFFAHNTKTKGGADISPVSLLNKFYDHEGNAEEVVKSVVIRMLNQIHKYK